MTVAAEFQRSKWRRLANMIRNHMVQRAVKRPCGTIDRVGLGAAEIAGRTLCMYVGALLKRAVHPGDQIDVLLHILQWLHGGREPIQLLHAMVRVLLPQRLHDVAKVSLGNDMFCFTRKEATTHDTNRHIKMSHAKRVVTFQCRRAVTFHPRKS